MRLLLVDDDPALLHFLEEVLREEGYAVDIADSGREGLDKALAWNYDAMLLDVTMPRLDGQQVLALLRRKKRTPVLMLTAQDSADQRLTGLALGADDYIGKPFELMELLARIRALIRRGCGCASSRLEIGDVSLDFAARSAERAGTAVILTNLEFALLEFLALNRGRVLTRTEIDEHLFDERDEGWSNRVAVHVWSIRRKLGGHVIRTRRGMGYAVPA